MRNGSIQVGPKWAQPFVVLVISSGVAGLATAPIGAAHFNIIAHYGLEEVGLWAMGFGLRWVLLVAGYVAGLHHLSC